MTQTSEQREAGRRSARRPSPTDQTPTAQEADEQEEAGRTDRRTSGSGRPPKNAPGGRAARTATAGRRETVAIGSEPRVHLLPPEVMADRKAAALRGRLGLGVLAAVAVVVLGSLGAGAMAMSAQTDLVTAQAATQGLMKQQLSYVEVRAVQEHVDLIETAQRVGASTEIAWMPYLQQVQDTLPPNVTITGVAVDSSTPIALYPQSTASLQGPRVATIVFTAQSRSLPEVPSWLTALTTLPGYADALPGSVTLDQSGVYTVTITMHVNDEAFANRFTKKSGN